MELYAIWNLIRRRWWLILLPGLAALVVIAPQLKNVISPPVTYSVAMRLTAAAPPDTEIDGVTTPYEDTVYVPLLASEYVVVNLPHWIASDRFAAEVSDVLGESGVAIPAADLQGAFAADSLRSILVLYVGWDDADEIRAIAQAAVTVLQTRNQAYFPMFPGPVEVIALDDVEVAEAAPPITARLNPLIRVAIGFAAGVGLALLAEYLDATVRERRDIEALGLRVIGEIPRER